MKFLLTTLLIFGLFGGVVGILTMDYHGDCAASYAAGIACPGLNSLAYFGIHIDFLKNFSSAFLIALFGVFLIFYSLLFVFTIFSKNPASRIFANKVLSFCGGEKQKRVEWLSLFENSPNLI